MSNLNDYLDKSFGKTTTTPSSSSSNLSKYLDENFNPKSTKNLKLEQNQYDQATQYANSPLGMTGKFFKAIPGAFYNNTVQPIIDAAKSGVSQVSQGYGQLTGPNQSLIQRGEGLLNIGAGAVNTVSSPVAPFMAGPSKAIQFAGDKLAQTPYLQKWGAANPQDGTLTPAERVLGGIVNATVIGGAIAPLKGGLLKSRVQSAIDVMPKSEYTKTGTVPITKELPVRSAEQNATPVNIQTPYLTPDQMPTIQMGPKAKSTLPTITTDTPLYSKLPEVKPAEFKPVESTPVLAKTKSIETKVVPIETTTVKPVENKVVTPQKTGAITKVARDLNKKLVKQGFDELPPEVQSKYTPESYKAIEKNVADLMTNDMQSAIDMATGKIPVNKSIHGHGEILFNAVARHASENLDSQLIHDLIKSPIGKQRSLNAQGLGESGFNSNKNSPLNIIQDIQNARKNAILKGKDIPNDYQSLKKHIENKAFTKSDIVDFIKNIKPC